MTKRICTFAIAGLALFGSTALPSQDQGIDPDALIERILTVDRHQREMLHDVTFDVELVVGEMKDDGFQEKERFTKKVFLKYEPDTVLFHESYLEYFDNGEKKSDEDCAKKAKERTEKAEKRKSQNISYPMLRPFEPEQREIYSIEYLGVSEERIDGYLCYKFEVRPNDEEKGLINGTYYFEADGFRLVRCDFSPAKLAKNLMFKMKELKMSVHFGPAQEGVWLPQRFDIQGKGKAMFLFGVNFAASETYFSPVINSGLDAKMFAREEKND